MKTTIYYFTGTGNSLVVSREISRRLGDCKLVPIAGLVNEKRVVAETEKVGFIFPLYYYGAPDIVIQFLKKLDLSKADYLFTVVTLGSLLGGAVTQLNEILAGQGRGLDSSFYVRMPGNYLVMYGGATEKGMQKDFRVMKEKVAQIADVVKRGSSVHRKESWIENKIRELAYPAWVKTLKQRSRLFTVEPGCNSCAVCSRVCPVNNIELKDGKPSWLDNCEDCMACIQHCPKEVIQAPSKKTRNRRRYTHPELSVKDMESQKM